MLAVDSLETSMCACLFGATELGQCTLPSSQLAAKLIFSLWL
jgi:hypothetical protein